MRSVRQKSHCDLESHIAVGLLTQNNFMHVNIKYQLKVSVCFKYCKISSHELNIYLGVETMRISSVVKRHRLEACWEQTAVSSWDKRGFEPLTYASISSSSCWLTRTYLIPLSKHANVEWLGPRSTALRDDHFPRFQNEFSAFESKHTYVSLKWISGCG